jgi:hypothetical protein
MFHDPRWLLTLAAGSPWNPTNGRRFAYRRTDADDALWWVRSLYLPAVSPRRIRAQRLTRRWAGSSIGIPLRVVAVRTQYASVSGFSGHLTSSSTMHVFSDLMAGRLDVDAAEASGRLRPDGELHDADIFARLGYPYPADKAVDTARPAPRILRGAAARTLRRCEAVADGAGREGADPDHLRTG